LKTAAKVRKKLKTAIIMDNLFKNTLYLLPKINLREKVHFIHLKNKTL